MTSRRRRWGRWLAVGLVLLVSSCGGRDERSGPEARHDPNRERSSESAPERVEGACEPSGAVWGARAPGQPAVAWVADDEEHARLFAYARVGAELRPSGEARIAGGERARDVEALAWDPDAGVLWMVGSHSRPSDGRPDARRRRLVAVAAPSAPLDVGHRGRGGPARIEVRRVWETAALGVDEACRSVFTEAVDVSDVDALCGAFVLAGGVDVEGAIVAEGRLWLGLRAPLVDGRAPMLRVVAAVRGGGAAVGSDDGGTSPTRVDAVAWLALDGAGVRDLTAFGATLVVTAGPPGDADTEFARYDVSMGELVPGARIEPRRVGALPEATEALLVIDDEDDGAFAFRDRGQPCERGEPIRLLERGGASSSGAP